MTNKEFREKAQDLVFNNDFELPCDLDSMLNTIELYAKKFCKDPSDDKEIFFWMSLGAAVFKFGVDRYLEGIQQGIYNGV